MGVPWTSTEDKALKAATAEKGQAETAAAFLAACREHGLTRPVGAIYARITGTLGSKVVSATLLTKLHRARAASKGPKRKRAPHSARTSAGEPLVLARILHAVDGYKRKLYGAAEVGKQVLLILGVTKE